MPREVSPNQLNNAVTQGVVLADFYTSNCGPCRQLAPLLAQFEQQMNGRVQVIKVNLDGGEAPQFGIQTVPTLMLFVNGQHVDTRQGFQNPQQLRAMVQPYV